MSQQAVLLLIAILGIMGTLSGAWLGSRMTRSNEDRKWRREHALEAYSNCIRLTDAIMEAGTKIYRAECGTVDYNKHGGILIDKLTELYRTTDRILLVSTYELQAPFTELNRRLPKFAEELARCPKIAEEEMRAIRSKLADLEAQFVMMARNDLGVHPRNQVWKAKPKWWRFWR